MTTEDFEAACQWLLGRLQSTKTGRRSYKSAEEFRAVFQMENRLNAARVQLIEAFLTANGILLVHKGEVRASLWDFAKNEALTLRLTRDTEESEDAGQTQAGQTQIKYPHARTVNVVQEDSTWALYPHQKEALEKLDRQIGKANKGPFAGLLVLPTGGGKTLTAAYWLAKNLLDQNKKILWIAHRHELLEQAADTFRKRLAFRNILPNRASFKYRIISGGHDKPVNIRPTDDLIFASKDSLTAGFNYLRDRWLRDQDEVFLVIDEAHHATARSYRKLIENLQATVRQVRLLGLTATPTRTAVNEQGLLAKVFPDGIVHKEDLRTLIHRGILSTPKYENVDTKINMVGLLGLTKPELDNIKYFDISSIGQATAKTIAENVNRNACIVNRYLDHQLRYRQTLVFALNQDNAIALKKLFVDKGVRCDYVLSSLRAQGTGASVSSKENKVIIDRFRSLELEVLINVNILTEGTDLPNVQTVFLARPTISSILMTQMIGRGLRGESVEGGTADAFIVSFIDNWEDKVTWVNPERLIIEENTDFNDQRPETQKQLVRLISISKIEEFAMLANDHIDKATRESLENVAFIERMPLGVYPFVFLEHYQEEAREKRCEILVYNNVQQAYHTFLQALPGLFAGRKFSTEDYLSATELDYLSVTAEAEFFHESDLYAYYRPQDVRDVLQYYYQKKVVPTFVALDDRARFDITSIAQHILDNDFGSTMEAEYLNKLWQENETGWAVFFGQEERYFLNEIALAKRRLQRPDLYQRTATVPTEEKELRRLEQMSMAEIQEHHPKYWKQLSDQVFAKYRDAEGYYVSPVSGYRSTKKVDFQIDHIEALSHGGLTTLENLQLLTRNENAVKGAS